MLIAQVSDLHMTPRHVLAQGKVETRTRLETVIDDLNNRMPRPDLVLFTGDLADNKNPESYDILKEILTGLQVPFFVIPGNHDSRAEIRRVFPDHPGRENSEFIQYVIDGYPVRLIAVDTLDDTSDKGLMTEKKLAWLDNTLRAEPQKPTLLFMHHPPFDSGIVEMDFYGLVGREALADVVRPHKQIVRILCGHLHRVIYTMWEGIPTSIAPSPSFSQAFSLAGQGPEGFTVEAPKYELHLWTGSTFITHMVSLEPGSGPFPYPDVA
ncbi:phosphodiesterase [Coralliovum pocilloporae]|uniref:phosphodiesterase n=1 Tax=Coralliovum pocilloporae TaxID=3066369 RepID=UPI0033075B76